jgi:predicted secreted protein
MKYNFSTSGKHYEILVIFAIIYHTKYFIIIPLKSKVVVYSGNVLLTTAEGIPLRYRLK